MNGGERMIGMIVRRILQLTFLLLGISFLVFMSMHLAPGDPATVIGGPNATSSDLEAIRDKMGLDRPVLVQYFDYLGGILQGDFGYSYKRIRQ